MVVHVRPYKPAYCFYPVPQRKMKIREVYHLDKFSSVAVRVSPYIPTQISVCIPYLTEKWNEEGQIEVCEYVLSFLKWLSWVI